MKRFKLKIPRTAFWFWVLVYDDLEAMQGAAIKYEKEVGKQPDASWHDTLGCCQPYTREVLETGRRHENIGIIRLAKGYLTSEIVSHELIHAICWTKRLLNDGERGTKLLSLGRQCTVQEEDFAYLYGRTFRELTNQLYKRQLWL